jgi:hypothetical protein
MQESSMRGLVSYLFAGIMVMFAIEFLAAPIGLAFIASPSEAAQAAVLHQTIVDDAGIVDRSHKGDRLTSPASASESPAVIRPAGRMIVGCDPVFSPLSAAARLNYPGRCVADGDVGTELLRAERVS